MQPQTPLAEVQYHESSRVRFTMCVRCRYKTYGRGGAVTNAHGRIGSLL
jgi:hypothetical protein